MKKYILSTLVIVSFVSYTIYYQTSKTDNDTEIVVVATSTPIVATTSLPTPVSIPKPVAKPAPIPAPIPAPAPVVVVNNKYRDGTYTGDRVYNYHGYIQVAAVITNDRIVEVNFLEYPTDGDSRKINLRATPILSQEAVSIQSSKVDTVSGATDSSGAFRKSLESALVQARV